MAERRKLINEYAKRVINRLSEEYPDYSWYLTLKEGREVMIGTREGKAVVIGTTYEDIVNSLALNVTIDVQ